MLLALLKILGENVGIPALLAIINLELITNPSLLANVKEALLAFADGVYRQYGMTPPTRPAA